MRLLSVLLISVTLSSCVEKEKQYPIVKPANPIFFNQQPAYLNNLRELLPQLSVMNEVNGGKLILESQPIPFHYDLGFLKDSTSFTPFEINYIRSESIYLSKIKFEDNLGDYVKVTEPDSINLAFNSKHHKRPKIFKQYGTEYIRMSHPIFLRNYTFCIVYLEFFCGSRCGGDSLALYSKINGKWSLTKSTWYWIS